MQSFIQAIEKLSSVNTDALLIILGLAICFIIYQFRDYIKIVLKNVFGKNRDEIDISDVKTVLDGVAINVTDVKNGMQTAIKSFEETTRIVKDLQTTVNNIKNATETMSRVINDIRKTALLLHDQHIVTRKDIDDINAKVQKFNDLLVQINKMTDILFTRMDKDIRL
jgi:methyl-accepting chemotaxis protein